MPVSHTCPSFHCWCQEGQTFGGNCYGALEKVDSGRLEAYTGLYRAYTKPIQFMGLYHDGHSNENVKN